MNNISEIGLNIKKIREKKKISAYKLAQLANVGNSTISAIESGDRQDLNSSSLEKIAKALNVRTDELFGLDDNSNAIKTPTNIIEFLDLFLEEDIYLNDELLNNDEKEILAINFKSAINIIETLRN